MHVFPWFVSDAGHKVREFDGLESDGHRLHGLTDDIPAGATATGRRYAPLDERALHRRFAATETTEAGLIAFANTYGLLGDPIAALGAGSGNLMQSYEPIAKWFSAIHLMRQVLAVFDVQRRQPQSLGRWVRWEGDSVRLEWRIDGRRGWHIVASTKVRPEMFARLVPGDLRMPALLYVQQVVNKELAGLVSPRLLLNDDGALQLFYVPSSLYGAIWLQLAQEVNGGIELRQCERSGCPEWFEIRGRGKTRQRFCSNACRVADFRANKVEGA